MIRWRKLLIVLWFMVCVFSSSINFRNKKYCDNMLMFWRIQLQVHKEGRWRQVLVAGTKLFVTFQPKSSSEKKSSFRSQSTHLQANRKRLIKLTELLAHRSTYMYTHTHSYIHMYTKWQSILTFSTHVNKHKKHQVWYNKSNKWFFVYILIVRASWLTQLVCTDDTNALSFILV